MENFLHGLTGRIVLPKDTVYEELRQGYNDVIQQYPFIIVYCLGICDVSNAVVWARKRCMPIRIRNGGHNYEGYSNGDSTIIIDLSYLNNVELDEFHSLIYLQGGATNQDVYECVSSRGYPFPGGTCPTVGVAGYASGGGWGLSCRYLGLGCDNIEEIEIVNYDGDLIIANSSCNSDLFWACKGAGGGNFGVIVGMTFRLPPPVEKVTLIEIDYLHVSSEDQEEFIKVWQNWLDCSDNRTTLISRIYNSKEDGLSMLVRGIFYGEPNEAGEILNDFLVLNNAEYNLEDVTFLEAVRIIGSSYPDQEKFKSASRFVINEFNSCEISNIVDIIKERSQGSVYAGISMYALGGKVSEISVDDTAFNYRNAKFIIWLETVWEKSEYAEINTEWINSRLPYLKSITSGSYVNFPYDEYHDYLEEYYGCHKVRLRIIKEKYDPLNIFTFPQGIKPSNDNRKPLLSKPKYINKYNSWNIGNDTNHREFRYVNKSR